MSLGTMGPSVTISSGPYSPHEAPALPSAFPAARLMLRPEAQADVGSWGLLSEFSVLSDLKLQPMFLRSQMVTLLPMSGIHRSARLYGSCSVN